MIRRLLTATVLAVPLTVAWAQGAPVRVPGLGAPAQLTSDTEGVSHIVAHSEADAWFLQGYVHARDRLFQMDEFRRTASGTLAELLGPAALASDVQLRTIGLRRAAERSLAALLPATRAALDAYVRGVNAYAMTHPLPAQYGALAITRFAPWEALDSVVVGKLFAAQLSLEIDVDSTVALQSYLQAGAALGFDGHALFFEDLDRAAPFDPASTIPDAMRRRTGHGGHHGALDASALNPRALELGRRWRESLRGIPALAPMLEPRKRPGSNLWAVSGSLTTTGRPMIANDRHLMLGTPPVWYPIGIDVSGQLQVFGVSFAGTPAVLGGYNRHIAWGSTNTLFDVTDTYQEQIVPYPASPSGLATLYQGRPEPVIPLPEVFRANQVVPGQTDHVVVVPPGGGIPAATLIVPRRNNGPIVQFDPASGAALSLQWVGFSATREFDAILKFAHAKGLDDFVEALQYFDVGSQNWVVGDDRGNIAYYSSGEVPVREDLQAGAVNGLPPNFIRNGQGGNEWLAVAHPQPEQALPFEVLPFAELPQIVNPPAGFFVNANNDPVGVTLDNNPFNTPRPGGGLYYLSYTFDDPSGLRAGQITQRLSDQLAAGRRISFEDMQSIQADVTLRDARFFVPYVTAAWDHARAPGANPLLRALAAKPGVAEAAGRLRRWNFSSPSGLVEGWDAGKPAGVAPSAASIDASVATTIYTLWRSRFIANTIDAVIGGAGLPVPDAAHTAIALRKLLEDFTSRGGRGVSGVDFFPQPASVGSAAERRDIVLLQSLDEALARLASDALKPAFANSTRQSDYRWGKLHRIVFASELGVPFSIPSAGGAFPAPLPGLAGIPTDGGLESVDAAGFDPRGSGIDDFMFSHGPSQRFVAQVAPGGTTRAEDVWPGGTSETLGSPGYLRFLPDWLANQALPLYLGKGQVRSHAAQVQILLP